MLDLDLLVPSSLVDTALVTDLLREQTMPNLSRILGRASGVVAYDLPDDASLTTWQAWVFGERGGNAPDRVNLGELWAMACGIRPAPRGGRFVVEPAHFKVANDHLRLDDPRELDVTLPEALALAAACDPVLAEAGWRLDPIEPSTLTHWLVARDDLAVLSGAAIERAIGDNVASWQPRAPDTVELNAQTRAGVDAALSWRSCVNEIQMLWFGHEVNQKREDAGLPTINTLWLSGNGAPMSPLPHYAVVDSGIPLLAALSMEPDAKRSLESFDRFIAPVRRDDWSGWREQLAHLDARLAAVIGQQADGKIGIVTLVFCGSERAKVVTLGPRDLGKFWRGFGRKPSLVELFGEGSIAGSAA